MSDKPPSPGPGYTHVHGHIWKDKDGRLYNNQPAPCAACGGKGTFCLFCGGNKPNKEAP